MSNHGNLSAATQDRKARLAQLKSLKRKQPLQEPKEDDPRPVPDERGQPPRKRKSPSRSQSPDVTQIYLSGRNYDATTRGPKLGFENAPDDGQTTLEAQARKLEKEEKAKREEDDRHDKPLDLFKLQPKKPNWDLKRDLQRRMEVLNVRTDNAIAKMIRERVRKAQGEAAAQKQNPDGKESDTGDAVGMDGAAFVEATREMEREDRNDGARMRRAEEDDLSW